MNAFKAYIGTGRKFVVPFGRSSISCKEIVCRMNRMHFDGIAVGPSPPTCALERPPWGPPMMASDLRCDSENKSPYSHDDGPVGVPSVAASRMIPVATVCSNRQRPVFVRSGGTERGDFSGSDTRIAHWSTITSANPWVDLISFGRWYGADWPYSNGSNVCEQSVPPHENCTSVSSV